MLTGANICGKNISPDFRAERPLRGGQLLVAGIADDVEGPGRLPPPNRHHPAHAAVKAAAGHGALLQGGRARRDRLGDEFPGDVVDDVPSTEGLFLNSSLQKPKR